MCKFLVNLVQLISDLFLVSQSHLLLHTPASQYSLRHALGYLDVGDHVFEVTHKPTLLGYLDRRHHLLLLLTLLLLDHLGSALYLLDLVVKFSHFIQHCANLWILTLVVLQFAPDALTVEGVQTRENVEFSLKHLRAANVTDLSKIDCYIAVFLLSHRFS